MNFLTDLLPHLFNGLNLGLLYAMLALGFTLIVGQMEIINMAHGSLFALGAYLTIQILGQTDVFNIAGNPSMAFYVTALILAPILVLALGMILEVPMRKTYGKKPLYGLLFTFGAAYVIEELIRNIWGTTEKAIFIPEILTGTIQYGDTVFSSYRFFASIFALVIIVVLFLVIEKTKLGAIIKAGAYDSEMVRALGINLKLLRMFVFGLGAFLAATAGVIMAPIWGIRPHMGQDVGTPAFLIVVLGGLGSFWGAAIAGILVGLAVGITGAYASAWATVSMYITLIIVLTVKHRGLFGKKSRLEE